MKNLFDTKDTADTIDRINKLTAETKPQWGKMDVGQMMAHCSVPYDMALTDKYPKAGAFTRFMMKLFVKSVVCGPKPYKKNNRTAPEFIINDQRDFETEKNRLIDNLKKVQELGSDHFHNKESTSFGPLTKDEWNVLFSKHIDHHLTQFGV